MKQQDIVLQGVSQGSSYFVKHAIADIRRRKLAFLLAFMSVFIVVSAILIINPILDKGFLVILKLGEWNHGHLDIVLSPRYRLLPKNGIESGIYINYTAIEHLYARENRPNNLIPRTNIVKAQVVSNFYQEELRDPVLL